MPAKQLIPLIVLLILLTVPGCGSDEVTQETTLSKAQFAKQADLICTAAANEQGKIATGYLEQHPNIAEVDLVEPAIIPPLATALGELKELGLPRGAEAQGEAFISDFEAALEAVEQEPAAALATRDNPFDKPNSRARTLKLGDCSQNP